MSSRNRITHSIVRLEAGGVGKSLYRLVKGTRTVIPKGLDLQMCQPREKTYEALIH